MNETTMELLSFNIFKKIINSLEVIRVINLKWDYLISLRNTKVIINKKTNSKDYLLNILMFPEDKPNSCYSIDSGNISQEDLLSLAKRIIKEIEG
jgi:hypothetical protein